MLVIYKKKGWETYPTYIKWALEQQKPQFSVTAKGSSQRYDKVEAPAIAVPMDLAPLVVVHTKMISEEEL
jgi:hypothetical protein